MDKVTTHTEKMIYVLACEILSSLEDFMKKCWENLSKITVIVRPPLKHFINDVYSKKQKLKSVRLDVLMTPHPMFLLLSLFFVWFC